MSGMLPGVECARRRRFHNSASPRFSTIRSFSFSFYIRNLQSPSLPERNMLNQPCPDENLVGAALEAKLRLDQKFMPHIKSPNQSSAHKRKGLFHALCLRLRS